MRWKTELNQYSCLKITKQGVSSRLSQFLLNTKYASDSITSNSFAANSKGNFSKTIKCAPFQNSLNSDTVYEGLPRCGNYN